MENEIMVNNILSGFKAASGVNEKTFSAADKTKAEEAAESFEAFFLSRMMESMFEGISTEGMFGGGQAEKIYRSLLLDEYGKEMAKVGSVSVKDYVMQAVLQLQENAAGGEPQK